MKNPLSLVGWLLFAGIIACGSPTEKLEEELIEASNKREYKKVIRLADEILKKDSTNLLAVQEKMLAVLTEEPDSLDGWLWEKAMSGKPVKAREYYNFVSIRWGSVDERYPELSRDSMASLLKKAFYLPDSDTFIQKQVIIFSEAFDRQSSITMTEAFLKKEPGNYELWARLGRMLHGEKRSEESVKAYLKTIDLEPKLATPYFGLSDVYREMGDTVSAKKYGRLGFDIYDKYPEINEP